MSRHGVDSPEFTHIISGVVELLQNVVKLLLTRCCIGSLKGRGSRALSRFSEVCFIFSNNGGYFQRFALMWWKFLTDVWTRRLVSAEVRGGAIWCSSCWEIYLFCIELVLSCETPKSISRRINICARCHKGGLWSRLMKLRLFRCLHILILGYRCPFS